jgi:hypothetical protein
MRALIVLIILIVAVDWIALKGKYSSAAWEDTKHEVQLLNIEVEQMMQKLAR